MLSFRQSVVGSEPGVAILGAVVAEAAEVVGVVEEVEIADLSEERQFQLQCRPNGPENPKNLHLYRGKKPAFWTWPQVCSRARLEASPGAVATKRVL